MFKLKLKSKLTRSARQNLVLFLILVLMIVFFGIVTQRFVTMTNMMNLARQNVPNILIAVAMTFVIVSGAIDLSVGGLMALSAIVYGYLCIWGVNPWLAFIMVIPLGILVGFINNTLIERLGIPAIMATMATWLITSSLALTLCKAIPISDPEVKPITVLNRIRFFGDNIPLALIIIIVVVAIFLLLGRFTLIGKYSTAIGGNPHAASLSGILVRRWRLLFFSICSVCAALSGVWQVARLGSADPKIGVGMEFSVITACILGGVSIKGGQGTVLGVVIATCLLAVLTNGMQMMGISPFYQQVVIGVVLLGAVLINQLLNIHAMKKGSL